MLKKVTLTVFASIFLVAGNLSAQDFQAFTKRPVTQEEYAKACETNNMNLLNVTCDRIVEAMNRRFPGLNLSGRQALADFIRRLDLKLCPQMRTNLARVNRQTKLIDLAGRERDLRPGEMCLSYTNDANDTIWVLSLLCGNIFSSEETPASLPPARVAALPQTPIRDAVIQVGGKVEVDVNHRFLNPLNVKVEGNVEDRQSPPPATPPVVVHDHSRWWVIPVTVAAVGAGVGIMVCTIRKEGCFNSTQIVTYGVPIK